MFCILSISATISKVLFLGQAHCRNGPDTQFQCREEIRTCLDHGREGR